MSPDTLLLFDSQEEEPRTVEIEIFHDEMLDDSSNPFAHQFLFIPVQAKEYLFKVLEDIRLKSNAPNMTINWKELSGDTRSRYLTAKQWLSIFIEALYERGSFLYPMSGGEILAAAGPLGVKSATFLIDSRDQLDDRYWRGSRISPRNHKYLTIFKIGIKGALHYLYNPSQFNISNLVVKKLYTDGVESNSLPLSHMEVLSELAPSLRPYITIEDTAISFVPKSSVKTAEVDLLELTDVVLGSTVFLGKSVNDENKEELTRKLREMYNKRNRGRGFLSSGHYGTFAVSKASVDSETGWSFEELDTNNYPGILQQRLSNI